MMKKNYSLLDDDYVTKFPSLGTDDSSYGSYAWNNPARITAEDGSDSYVSLPGSGLISHYLKGTQFGFSIPSGATIQGILAEIKCGSSIANSVKDNVVKLVKGGVVSGNNEADTTNYWTTSDAWKSHGGSSDLWGLSLSPGDINSSNFGMVLAAIGDSAIAYVDAFRITVYYVVPTYKDGSATLSALGSLSAQSSKVKLGSGIMLAQASLSAQPAKVKLGSGIMLAQASLSAFGEKASKGFPVQHLAYRKDLLFTG